MEMDRGGHGEMERGGGVTGRSEQQQEEEDVCVCVRARAFCNYSCMTDRDIQTDIQTVSACEIEM